MVLAASGHGSDAIDPEPHLETTKARIARVFLMGAAWSPPLFFAANSQEILHFLGCAVWKQKKSPHSAVFLKQRLNFLHPFFRFLALDGCT